MKRGLKIACVLAYAALCAPATLVAQEVSADSIISACTEAMGGRAAVDALRTLRLRYRLPDHGGPSLKLIKRPNLYRAEPDIVFDGARAAILARSPLPDGTTRPAELVPAEELKDFEMQIGWLFPAFFDYPARHVGVESIDGIETHKLEVVLPLGARLTYYIDAATHLPLMVESNVTLHGKHTRYFRRFGDFRENAGVLYPHWFTYFSHRTKELYIVTIDELDLNVRLDDSLFAVPDGLDEPN